MSVKTAAQAGARFHSRTAMWMTMHSGSTPTTATTCISVVTVVYTKVGTVVSYGAMCVTFPQHSFTAQHRIMTHLSTMFAAAPRIISHCVGPAVTPRPTASPMVTGGLHSLATASKHRLTPPMPTSSMHRHSMVHSDVSTAQPASVCRSHLCRVPMRIITTGTGVPR